MHRTTLSDSYSSEGEMTDYPSITYHNPTGICGDKKWEGFRREKFSTDIIAIAETHFHEKKEDRQYDESYEGFFCDRKRVGRQPLHHIKGGCALWLKTENCTNGDVLFRENGDADLRFEALCVTFTYERKDFAVLVVYNPPRKTKFQRSRANTRIVERMLENAEKLSILRENCIVIGDFNRTTLGSCRSLRGNHYDYSRGVSGLDQIYGFNDIIPYSVDTRNPNNYNTNHEKRSLKMHRILELYSKCFILDLSSTFFEE